jgi:Spy/CpxP family protein refolding chaperone
VERLRQITVEAEKANVRTRAEIAVRRIEVREALRAEKPDRDQILQKVREISELRGQLMKADVEAILAAKAVLTPAQQRKLLYFLESRQAKEAVGEEENGRRPQPSAAPAPAPQAIPIHPGEPPVQ